jgi:hypothetical protein
LESENQDLLIRKESTQAEVNRLHKELELEIEKAARQRDALNQKYLIFEQESQVFHLHLCITEKKFFNLYIYIY